MVSFQQDLCEGQTVISLRFTVSTQTKGDRQEQKHTNGLLLVKFGSKMIAMIATNDMEIEEDLTEFDPLDDDEAERQKQEQTRLAQHAAAKTETLKKIERLDQFQERLEEELKEQKRLEEKQKERLEEEAIRWKRQSKSSVTPFQKVGNEFVDQDKMERKRRGKLAAQAIRDAAQKDIMAWREGFRAKFANGKGEPRITAASPELVMRYT